MGVVAAINRAFSLAKAETFRLGIGAALVAVVVISFLREVPHGVGAHAAAPSPRLEPTAEPGD